MYILEEGAASPPNEKRNLIKIDMHTFLKRNKKRLYDLLEAIAPCLDSPVGVLNHWIHHLQTYSSLL